MHRQRKPARTYRLGRVFALAALLTAVVFGTVSTTAGLDYDWRHMIGFGLGLVLVGRLVADLLHEIDPPASSSPGEDETRAAERIEIANTASWRRLGAEHPSLIIRHNPLSGAYYVRGHFAGVHFLRSVRWETPSRLYAALISEEENGLRPDADEGTRVVRARIGLPEWRDPHAARTLAPVADNRASSVHNRVGNVVHLYDGHQCGTTDGAR
jgi:hypothetical protein